MFSRRRTSHSPDASPATNAGARTASRRFQARFACFKIRCHDCGTLNICAQDGTAFKAIVEAS